MNRKHVISTRIRSVGWENNILEIEFNDGVLYHYTGVSNQEYINFINSPSLGSALKGLEQRHPYHRA